MALTFSIKIFRSDMVYSVLVLFRADFSSVTYEGTKFNVNAFVHTKPTVNV